LTIDAVSRLNIIYEFADYMLHRTWTWTPMGGREREGERIEIPNSVVFRTLDARTRVHTLAHACTRREHRNGRAFRDA
jgi:hypothetical protein